MGLGWPRRLGILVSELIYMAKMVRYALLYFGSLAVAFVFAMLVSGIPLTVQNLVLLLSLNYEPKTFGEAICLLIMVLIQLSPVMAFVEARTLTYDEKAKLMAGKMREHIIVVGCGHLGRRICYVLRELEAPFVVVVLPRDRHENEYVAFLMKEGVPVIFGDARMSSTLLEAGIERARAIMITVNDDVVNSVIARRARELNPGVRVVVRIYGDEFADILLKSGYANEVVSTTAIAVLSCVASCFVDVELQLPGLVAIKIRSGSRAIGMTIAELEEEMGIDILATLREGRWLRDRGLSVKEGDTVVICGDLEGLRRAFAFFT